MSKQKSTLQSLITLRREQAIRDYEQAQLLLQQDLQFVQTKGVKPIIANQIQGAIAPPGSRIDRLLHFFKRKKSSSPPTMRGYAHKRHSTTDPIQLVGIDSTSAHPHASAQTSRLGSAIQIARPVLVTIGIAVLRKILRKKIPLLRFFI